MVFEKLSKIIADQLGLEQSKISKTTSLKEELQADSLDIVEIIMSIEEEFGIQVDDNDALAFKTVSDVADYIEKNI
ncbi:MAG: acyl carrier protein [Clostridia bacterium]|nr:acyl carrier protein [Clostridia bacterium]